MKGFFYGPLKGISKDDKWRLKMINVPKTLNSTLLLKEEKNFSKENENQKGI